MVTRVEHRRRTLLGLSAATTAALEANGPDATIDDIAARAGVSRRTVYRWVDTRDDLIFIHPRLWIEIFDEAVAEVADESLRTRIQHGARRVSEHIDADPAPVRSSMMVALLHPSLMRGYAAVSQEWVERMAAEVLGDATDGESRFRARILGAAIMGVIDAALNAWMATDPAPPLISLVEPGLDYLSPILD